MAALAGVLAAVLTLGVLLPPSLTRLRLLDRWPRTTAWLWLAVTGGALAALAVAALLLVAASLPPLDLGTAEVLPWCAAVLRATVGRPVAAAGLAVGVAVFAALAGGVTRAVRQTVAPARHALRRHRDLLALTATRHDRLPGVRVLAHPDPVAYCLPGASAWIVVSSGTLDRLDDAGLAAVVAHERAHQRGRHHRLTLAAAVLARAVPWLPAARHVSAEVGRALELAADDAAAARLGRDAVADALRRLLDAPPAPAAGLGAIGTPTATSERIARLSDRPLHGGRVTLTAVVTTVAVALLLPVAAFADPLGHLFGAHLCPLL